MQKIVVLTGVLLGTAVIVSQPLAQRGSSPFAGLEGMSFEERAAALTRRFEERGLADPFRGISSDGNIVPGLYEIEATGVSTVEIRDAAVSFLDSLSDEQRARTSFAVDDDEWRKWMNPHIYVRQGVSFAELDDTQTNAAIALLRASLSAKGLTLAQDIMRLNTTLAELNDNNFLEYGEDKYHLTLMGAPSATAPWGWQLEGHHLAINYFVLGDQVVMAPVFWGSEPAVATSGRYAGTAILQDEQAMGLAVLRSLNAEQRRLAVLDENKTSNNVLAQAFADNVVVPVAGLPVTAMNDDQRRQLMSLIRLWIYNLRDDHADVQIEQIEQHLDETHFAWIGGSDDDSVFYYRVQSPVLLIEFDHNTPVGLSHLYPRGVPYKEHVHAVVRLPNGNDYGKDLLRQHLLAVAH